MAKKKCPECPDEGAPAWLLTYGDMTTLLLTFFVMLFTTAKIDGREFKLILSAFQGALGIFDGGQTLQKGKLEEMGMSLESLPSQTRGRALSKAVKRAKEMLKPLIRDKKVRVSEDERGIVISLLDVENFDPGSAKLKPSLKKALDMAGPMLMRIPNFIRIEGHADREGLSPVPTDDSMERDYQNDWDLASARALNTLNYLVYKHQVSSKAMSAVSYGSARPLATDDGGLPETRAMNRRIDIIILNGRKYKRMESSPKNKLPPSKIPGLEYKSISE